MNAHDVMLTKGIAYRKTVRQLEAYLKPHQLSVAEWLCLGTVASGAHGGGKIASLLGVTKGMASRQLSELESRGLVQEKLGKNDARSRTYKLSIAGEKLLHESDLSATIGLKEWLGSIEPEHVRIYVRVLQIVATL